MAASRPAFSSNHWHFSGPPAMPTPEKLRKEYEKVIGKSPDGRWGEARVQAAIDVAKAIALMARQDRALWDFEDVGNWWTRADADAIVPNIAVPTTAGTGSEVGRASVITNSMTHEKKIIFHPKVLPSVVIADPELTVGMPKAITAGTGLDAFAHCVEAFSSPHYHPMSQGIALEGMRLVIDNLPRAYDTPGDLEARANMMSAAAMGAVAFQKGLGAIHAMSHPVGAIWGTHHGTTNAVCMPPVLDLNAPAIRDRFDMAAAYLGIEGGFDGFRAFVQALNDQMGIPRTLSEVGADPAQECLGRGGRPRSRVLDRDPQGRIPLRELDRLAVLGVDVPALPERDDRAQPARLRPPGHVLPSGPSAYDDHVIFVHHGSPRPVRSELRDDYRRF